MSLPTESSLTSYQYSGGIYGKMNPKNDKILLNIKGNPQSNNEDKSIQLNETEANLQLKDIYNNKNIHKSLKQRPNQNQILYYDKINNNQYPFSDNLRNQLNLNDKYSMPINNLNNNAINEINMHQNNNQPNYNTIQVNTESTLRNYNGNGDFNTNIFQNNNIQFTKSKKKCNCKKCFIKTLKISGLVLLIILIILLYIICLGLLNYGNSGNGGDAAGSSGSNEVISSRAKSGCCCCFCGQIKQLIRKIREIYNS